MVLSLQILNKHILTDNLWAEINFVYFLGISLKPISCQNLKKFKIEYASHRSRIVFIMIQIFETKFAWFWLLDIPFYIKIYSFFCKEMTRLFCISSRFVRNNTCLCSSKHGKFVPSFSTFPCKYLNTSQKRFNNISHRTVRISIFKKLWFTIPIHPC